MEKYEATYNPTEQDGTAANPARANQREADFSVPLRQTAVSAGFVAAAVIIVPLGIYFVIDYVWLGKGIRWSVIALPLLVMFLTAYVGLLPLFWFFMYDRRAALTLQRLEKVFDYDFNDDGYIGEPAPAPRTEVIINNVKRAGSGYETRLGAGDQVHRIIVSMSEAELKMVGYRLAQGWPYSRPTFVEPPSTISQERYNDTILPELRDMGMIIEEKGKRNQMTEKAKVFWKNFQPPTYPPSSDGDE